MGHTVLLCLSLKIQNTPLSAKSIHARVLTPFRVHHTRDTFVRQHHLRGPRAAPPHQGLQGPQRRRMCSQLPDRLRQHRE